MIGCARWLSLLTVWLFILLWTMGCAGPSVLERARAQCLDESRVWCESPDTAICLPPQGRVSW